MGTHADATHAHAADADAAHADAAHADAAHGARANANPVAVRRRRVTNAKPVAVEMRWQFDLVHLSRRISRRAQVAGCRVRRSCAVSSWICTFEYPSVQHGEECI